MRQNARLLSLLPPIYYLHIRREGLSIDQQVSEQTSDVNQY